MKQQERVWKVVYLNVYNTTGEGRDALFFLRTLKHWVGILKFGALLKSVEVRSIFILKTTQDLMKFALKFDAI